METSHLIPGNYLCISIDLATSHSVMHGSTSQTSLLGASVWNLQLSWDFGNPCYFMISRLCP